MTSADRPPRTPPGERHLAGARHHPRRLRLGKRGIGTVETAVRGRARCRHRESGAATCRSRRWPHDRCRPPLERRCSIGRNAANRVARSGRLHDHLTQRVREHVVQLGCDPLALMLDGALGGHRSLHSAAFRLDREPLGGIELPRSVTPNAQGTTPAISPNTRLGSNGVSHSIAAIATPRAISTVPRPSHRCERGACRPALRHATTTSRFHEAARTRQTRAAACGEDGRCGDRHPKRRDLAGTEHCRCGTYVATPTPPTPPRP